MPKVAPLIIGFIVHESCRTARLHAVKHGFSGRTLKGSSGVMPKKTACQHRAGGLLLVSTWLFPFPLLIMPE